VFNLLDRAAQHTGLTRPTVNRIFKAMNAEKRKAILDNPEGFANVFVAELRNALADHVTERIEFVVDESEESYDLGELFPPTKRYPQKEVLDAGPHGLYDLIQKDSDVEVQYVEAIQREGESIVFFFKFPADFKVHLPAVIGNYVPDWGIARVHRNGQMEVRSYVHETKGGLDLARLRFPHEKRKIKCAEKYFAAMGINYLTIDPRHVGGWWDVNRPGQLPLES
jgi:type III restriction enzyme